MVGTRLVSPCLRRHQCVSAPVSLRCTPPHTRPIRRLEARRTAAPDDWDAEEAALDAESVDPFAENEDDGDVEYPPELSLEDTDRLSFVDDPDEFWRLVMDEEAYDDKLFKLAVADSGAATKPSVLARMEKQKPRIAIEKYLELLPKLQEREGFVSDIAHTYEPVVETIPDPLPRHRTNPDWDEWDFRALLEDQRQRAAVDAAWNAERAEIGRFHYEVPSWPDDLRFKDRPAHEEDTSEWDEERIMALITQDGRSPRIEEVEGLTVCNPNARADFLASGYEPAMDVEDYIESLGRMLHEGQEAEADREVAMLASDFADFDINMSTIENPLEEDDDEGDPNDDEAPRDL